MEYKTLAFHKAFDVIEMSLNKWAAEGWQVVTGWRWDYTITIVLARPAEAHDRAGEAWQEGHYQPGVSDPADGGT